MKINSSKYVGIPPQKLVDSAKDKSWVEQNFRGLMYMCNTNINGRTSRYEKQVLYNLVNSIYEEDDFKHVVDPYGYKDDIGKQPATLQNYNIIRDKIELLKGEEVKLPFSWNVVGKYGEVIREKDEQLQNALLGTIQQALASALQGQEVEIPGLEEIESKYKIKYLDVREKNASHIIKQTIEQDNLRDKFNDGWEHALISAEEIYYVGKKNGKPSVRVVNPLNSDFDKDPDLKYIQQGNWFREERLMSAASILDEYNEFLSDSDIEKLDNAYGGSFFSTFRNSNYLTDTAPNPKYQPGEQVPPNKVSDISQWNVTNNGYNLDNTNDSGILVTTIVWKSMRRMDYLNYFDEAGNPQTDYVDQKFRLSKEQKAQGWSIESEWITDVWKATGISCGSSSDDSEYSGDNLILVDYGALETQTGELPYVGYVYSNTNSRETSAVGLVKSLQYEYMITMYKISNEIAKFKGAKLIFDIAQIPTTGVNGMSPEKWLYYFDVIGIGWVNSFEEGQQGQSTGQRANFNQFQMVQDHTLDALPPLIAYLDKIENQVQRVLGVSDQRLGAIGSSETVGGVERSVIQSSAITASLFMKHNQVKKAVLQQVLEVGKLCVLEDNEATQLIVDDVYRELVKIDAEQLNDSEYEVYVSDSMEIAAIKESIKAIAPQALQSDKLNFSEYIKLLQSHSISEISSIIRQGEDAKVARDMQAQQSQQEQAQMQVQSNEKIAMEQMDRDDKNQQLDRDNKIQVATINALRSKDGATDMNNDGIPDPVAMGQLALKQGELNYKQNIEGAKLQAENLKTQASIQDSQTKNELALKKLQLEEAKLNNQATKEQVDLTLQANENHQQNVHKKLDLLEKSKDRQLKKYDIDKKLQASKYKTKSSNKK